MIRRLILAFSGAALSATLTLSPAPVFAVDAKKNGEDTYRLLNLFGDVFERVRAEYVEPPSEQEMIEAAITGMLSALDPHSSFLNSKRFQDMQTETRGEFGGLGITVTMERGFVKVISPIDDTPAHRAGIESGDFITHLDGEAVQGLTLSDAVEKMRGKVGSDIRITIVREGREPFDVTLTRAVIKVTTVRSHAEGKAGYIRITSFTEQTDASLKKAIAKLKEEIGKDLQGYVLDLRNNPGGLLDQAVAVSDVFLDKGEIVSTRSRNPEDTQRFNARPGDLADGLPLVVLINSGSASASEIVAGALQDHRRAVLLGTKTFGKGSVQSVMPLAGNGAMKLTTARYYTPSGRSIQAKGIDPDILVQQSKIEALKPAGRRSEADLRGALDNEDGTKAGSRKDDKKIEKKDEKAKPAPAGEPGKKEGDAVVDGKDKPQDYQLSRALDLIRGLAILQKPTAKAQ